MEVALNEEKSESRARRTIRKGAMVAGAAGAGYLAGRVAGIRQGLSNPRDPFEWRPEGGRTVLLRGVNIVDVKRGQLQRERGLLFQDGRITGVISTRDLGNARADSEFDCAGLFAMPGLINCHVHMLMPGATMPSLDLVLSIKRQALRNMEECAVRGVTTVRDAGGVPLLLGDLSGKVQSLDLLGPRIISCGPNLMPKGGYPDFSGQLPELLAERWGDPAIYVDGPQSAREAVRAAVAQGAQFIKIFFDDRSFFYGRKPLSTMDDDSITTILDEAHRLDRRVAVHQTQLTGFRRAVRLGVDDFEHFPLDGPLTAREVASFMDGDHHFTPTPSVGLALAVAPDGHPSLSNPLVRALQSMRWRLLTQIGPSVCEEGVERANLRMVHAYLDGSAEKKPGARFMFDNELLLEAIGVSSSNVTMLYEAGARLCCGNDGGTPLSFPGVLSQEMELLEMLGVSRPDILRAATITAAGLLGLEPELGSLEKGKLADILLLAENPLEDIRAAERVEGVFREGVLLHSGSRLAPPGRGAGQT